MNISKLKERIEHNDTAFYNEFKNFILALNKNRRKYKLFHLYLFRTDCLFDMIKNNKYFFYETDNNYLIDGKINYKNQKVKRYVDENSYVYVGNVYLKTRNIFAPIFLSYRNIESYKINCKVSNICGFSINADENDFYFADGTTKHLRKLKKNEMNNVVEFSSGDLKNNIYKMLETTKEHL